MSKRETHVYVIACLAFLSVLETNLDIRWDIKVMHSCMTIEIHLLSVNQMQSLPINGLRDRINHYYPTRSSSNIGIVTPNISKTFSNSNYHNNAHILFRNIPPYFRNVHDYKVYSLKIRGKLVKTNRSRLRQFTYNLYLHLGSINYSWS